MKICRQKISKEVCINKGCKIKYVRQSMEEKEQYKIFVGYNDSQTRSEDVSREELTNLVTNFFKEYSIDFSLSHCSGGYVYSDDVFVSELTMIINIIGNQGLDIFTLAKSLAMYMNQESVLVVKETAKTRYL